MIRAVDTESWLIVRPVAAPKTVCVSWATAANGAHVELPDPARIASWLAADTVVGHHFAFDAACLMAWFPELTRPIFEAYEAGRIHDTMLREKLLKIATGELDETKRSGGFNLQSCCERYGISGVNKADTWRLRYGELDGTPVERWPAEAVEYARRDASATLELYLAQEAVDGFGDRVLAPGPAEAYAALAYQLTHCWGVRTDARRVADLRADTKRRLADWREKLVKAGLIKVDKKGKHTRDTKEAKVRMRSAFSQNDAPISLTATGEIRTDAGACALSGDPMLVMYADYTSGNKLLDRVDELANGIDLPLQSGFDTMLDSARASARTGKVKGKWVGPMRGVALHQMPREGGSRECLEPRPGHVLVVSDYAQCELHSTAQTCLDMGWGSELGKVLNAKRDVYVWFAAEAFLGGIGYDTAKALPGATLKPARQASKAIILGVPGGMGKRTLALSAKQSYGVDMTEAEAGRLRGLYVDLAPELRELFAWVSRQTSGNRRVTLTHPRTGYTRGKMTYSEACNWLCLQHLSAVLFKAAYTEVTRQCYADTTSPLYRSHVVAPVHDELVLETPEDLASDACHRLEQIMVEQAFRWLPDVPVRCEALVAWVWSKQAKRIELAGKLVPWEGGV